MDNIKIKNSKTFSKVDTISNNVSQDKDIEFMLKKINQINSDLQINNTNKKEIILCNHYQTQCYTLKILCSNNNICSHQ